ncbi:hypothetical protein [Streptomyces sp. NPDC088812]|uniref:rhamnogalacturonan endolyase family protein n=1 Tax=Streptomyces sp. NPDC088812 TaxID=3365905 RepID=UPI003822D10C
MERLGRGVVAVRSGESAVFVSWRLLALDPQGIGFNVYRSTGGGSYHSPAQPGPRWRAGRPPVRPALHLFGRLRAPAPTGHLDGEAQPRQRLRTPRRHRHPADELPLVPQPHTPSVGTDVPGPVNQRRAADPRNGAHRSSRRCPRRCRRRTRSTGRRTGSGQSSGRVPVRATSEYQRALAFGIRVPVG